MNIIKNKYNGKKVALEREGRLTCRHDPGDRDGGACRCRQPDGSGGASKTKSQAEEFFNPTLGSLHDRS
jgi:hypothetical protein